MAPEIATCNCAWGCPCQFNGLPTHGDCRAAVAMQIEKGHFGAVSLDGLKWVGLFRMAPCDPRGQRRGSCDHR